MSRKRVTLLSGGTYHDFEGFEEVIGSFLRETGCQVQVTRDPNVLSSLTDSDTDTVMLYTCLGGSKDGDSEGRDFAPDQVASLVDWVRGGGALLALHASTVSSPDSQEMRRLLGGSFISHPPDMLSFTVTPVAREHPITLGIGAFEVFDEFYVERYDDSVQIHMTAALGDESHPMVWSRSEGQGRVVHIAPGHDHRTWELPAYRRLILQSLDWAAGA